MLKHQGDGFHSSRGGVTQRHGPAVTAAMSGLSVEERVADGVHTALINREGGFPVACRSRGGLMLAIDACTDELGHGATRRLLLQAARALR
jgi:hypothetical protein